jgi:transcriptional regulator with XRE-family HTH domain
MSPSRPVTTTTQDFAKRFGTSIRWARKHELAVTQGQLTDRMNQRYIDLGDPARVTQSNVSRWEKGHHVPRKHLAVLLHVLDHDYPWFFTEHPDDDAMA